MSSPLITPATADAPLRAGHARRRRTTALAGLAVLLAGCAAAGSGTGRSPTATAPAPASPSVVRASPEVFGYARSGPVEVTDVASVKEQGRSIRDVTFPSPKGGDVPAYIAEPTQDPTGAGVLMLPGVPESRHDYLDPLARFACAGATAMVIAAPYARDPQRPAYDPITFTARDRDEQIQLIVDLRRAVDLLQEAGVERIGFDAISYGASMGAQLAGVEHRIDAFALLSANGGLVDRFISPRGNPLYPLAARSQSEIAAWVDLMAPMEPVLFIGDATAPILLVYGRRDPIIEESSARAMQEAAGDRAEVRWYDTDHNLSPKAFLEHLNWLADQIGLNRDRVRTCFQGAF